MKVVMLEGATQFKDSVTKTNAAMTDMSHSVANEAEKVATVLKDGSTQVHNTTRDMLENLHHGSKNLQGELERSIQAVLNSIRESSERTLGGVEGQIREAVNRSGEGVNRQLAALDQSLQQELNRAMEDLGRALASIAQKMTEEYNRMVNIHSNPQNNYRA